MKAEEFGYGSPEVLALLRGLDLGEATVFRPLLDPETRAVAYPSRTRVLGVRGEDAPRLLEFLAKEEILVRDTVESYHH